MITLNPFPQSVSVKGPLINSMQFTSSSLLIRKPLMPPLQTAKTHSITSKVARRPSYVASESSPKQSSARLAASPSELRWNGIPQQLARGRLNLAFVTSLLCHQEDTGLQLLDRSSRSEISSYRPSTLWSSLHQMQAILWTMAI